MAREEAIEQRRKAVAKAVLTMLVGVSGVPRGKTDESGEGGMEEDEGLGPQRERLCRPTRATCRGR
jgi:hypothetical protein